MEIKSCPFCKKNIVEFIWTSFPWHGRVECKNWKDECCAHGPQIHRFEKYDNIKRLENRAIKAWNKRR